MTNLLDTMNRMILFTRPRTDIRRAVLRLVVTAAAMTILTNVDAAPSWPMAPYTYFANQESLEDVLQRFASGFSLSLHLSGGVAGVVNGKFTAATPTEFMDKLAGVYGLTWFVYAGTLFVSPASAMVTKTISVGNGAISGLRQALDKLGVIDDRFGWGELPDQGLALVSGPPQYVDLIERTIKALPPTAGRQEVAVFRLKYASVNDRVVRYRDQSVTTPGLATVLRNLIEGSGPGPGNGVLASLAAPLRDTPPMYGEGGMTGAAPAIAGNAGERTDAPARSPTFADGLRRRQATVQSDPRLNAIIVQDIPERIPVYRALIQQLDVPSTLIEIEAMIVDVKANVTKELGVRWGASAGNTDFGYGYPNPKPADRGDSLTPGMIGLGVGDVLIARLMALQNNDDANILSRPSILTADNMGALIDLSRTFFIKTTGERVAYTQPYTVGTSLRVTPRYIDGKDGPQVELTVDIEDGGLSEDSYIEGLPQVNKTTISTLALVGDGQALVIGGYNSSTDGDAVNKVPILGDIPGIGVLFSHKKKTTKRWERMFMIRPRVVQVNGAPLVPESLRKWGDLVGATWEGGKRPTAYTEHFGPELRMAAPQETTWVRQ
jgi:type III secretion protein C